MAAEGVEVMQQKRLLILPVAGVGAGALLRAQLIFGLFFRNTVCDKSIWTGAPLSDLLPGSRHDALAS
jgi:hypothetical protein